MKSPVGAEVTTGVEETYRNTIRAWCLYDWANSAFATVILAAVYPVFFRAMAQRAGLANEVATALWSYSNSIAMVVIATLGPVLGVLADARGRKKPFVAVFMGIGVLASAFMAFLGSASYLAGAVLLLFGMVGFTGANIFYEAMLPGIAREQDVDRISSQGYALGYVGGGCLLVINLVWLSFPTTFGFSDRIAAVRGSFISVAIWWAVFSLPLFRHIPESGAPKASISFWQDLGNAVRRLRGTVRTVRRYHQLALFLAAFWIYNDGVSTIIKMAVAFGDELGISQNNLVLALVITQFVGIPCTMGFSRLSACLGAKRAVLLGLVCYGLICCGAFFMETAMHFYVLAIAVGLVQGGTQALSRSLFSSMVPRERASEFFGFFSTGEKFAGILGPVLFGVIGQLTGSSRWGILSVGAFFVIGGWLLCRVDEFEGRRAASQPESVELR